MTSARGLRLCVFSEDTVYRREDGVVEAGNPLPVLYEKLAEFVGSVTLSAPVLLRRNGIAGKAFRISLSARPYYGGSVVGFFKNLPRIALPTLRNIRANVRNSDLVMLQLPSPIGFLVYREAKKFGKPCFIYVVGDVRRVVTQGGKYRNPIVRSLAILAANVFHRLTRRMAWRALVFVTGSELYEELSPLAARGVNLIPSVVSEGDIFIREDTCLREPIRLLYVGRLVPVKGLEYLFQALRYLVEQDPALELQLVGGGYHRPRLESLAEELGITEYVGFLGRIPFGPELFRIYREADIFVLPSLSEGIPKTLLEAMASGLPIVATRVGGIPDVIRDGETGLLVGPRSPEQIARAVERLIADSPLRRKVIQNGYAFVKDHTVERQAEMMWQEIRNFFCLER